MEEVLYDPKSFYDFCSCRVIFHFIITTLIVLSVFVWKIFPVCFVEGVGLTPFKKISEYIICSILLAGIFILNKNKNKFEPQIYRNVLFSIIFTIISELSFTFYINNYGFSNLVGGLIGVNDNPLHEDFETEKVYDTEIIQNLLISVGTGTYGQVT
ncbi:MAG: hypothetical protein LC657_01990 [Desulfobacteraceae bacterium]|nr:hypothetical protein [Desulfobacteraceae bacterium]